MGRNRKENINWDKGKKRIVITTEEVVDVDAEDTKDLIDKLNMELHQIVRDVKSKKKRAGEIKELLAKLKEKPPEGGSNG